MENSLLPSIPARAIEAGTTLVSDRFAAVADSSSKNSALRWFCFSHRKKGRIADEIMEKAHEKLILSPKINQRQLHYLISRSRLYIGLDSGSMHICFTGKNSVVAIFGPSDVIQNKPSDYAPFRIVQGDAECAPCRNRTCKERHCMDAVQVEDVIAAVQELIES